MEDRNRAFEECGLDPDSATESDLQGARMQRLSDKLGGDVEQMTAQELDEARLRIRKEREKVRENTREQIPTECFLYWQ